MSRRIRQEIRKLPAYHLDQPEDLDRLIKLDQNESPYDVPRDIKSEILVRLVKAPWNRYPSPYAESLTKQVAESLGWDPEGVLLANGSNLLTQSLIMASSVGGRIVIPDPTFSLYELYGRALSNKVYRVPLKKNFSLDVAAFQKKVDQYQPELIFIANPNAPTGTLFPQKDLEEIINEAPGIVVVDEAYYHFCGESLLEKLKEHKHLVLLRTFSKAYGLGGVRIGYLLGSAAIVSEVRKVLPPFNLSRVAQVILETWLDYGERIDEIVTEIINQRQKLYVALNDLDGVTAFASATNFILFKVPNAQEVYVTLIDKGVLVRNVSDEKRLKNCLRVSIGTPDENKRFLKVLKKIL